MANASIGGIVSGLDTATIIRQFMQLEAIPQSSLKTRMSSEQSALTALQSLNGKLAAIATQAADLAGLSAWSPVTASSSSEHVAVRTTGSATTGGLSFTVNQTALAHQLSFVDTVTLTDPVTAGSTEVIFRHSDGTTRTIETGDGTLQGFVDAVNSDPDVGVRASTVKLDDGTYRLSLQSTTTGNASHFTLSNTDGSDLLGGTTNVDGTSRVVAGRDAEIIVGTDKITSSSNTFAGVLTGVDFTLGTRTPVGTEVDIAVTTDTKSMTASVKALVDAVNAVLGDIDKLAARASDTTKAGVLAGDATLRSLRNELLSSVYASADGSSLADAGIELDRYGRLTLDEEKFAAAYAAGPAAVSGKLAGAGGFAERVTTITKLASNPVDGTVTNAISGRTSTVDRLEDDIASWDVRLARRRETLERQYSALEVALSRLQSQGSWLASQLAGLPSYSS